MSKRIPASELSAAMSTAEQEVAVPSRRQSGSMKSQVEGLEPGECCSKVALVEPGMSLDGYAAEAPAMRERMRNGLTSTVAKAKELTGGTYSIEVGNMVLGNRIYLVAVVSRTV